MKQSKLVKIEEKLFSHSLGSKLGHSVKAMAKLLSERLARHDLHISLEQIFVLVILDEGNRLIQQDIAQIMSKDKSAVFRQIDSLERKHLVARMENPDDKRQKVLMLTKKGVEILTKTREIQSDIITSLTHDIAPSELKTFENVLHKIYDNATKS